MLKEPDTAKIRRIRPNMCHMSHKKSHSFKDYGLNIYKNFLEPNTFYCEDSGVDDMSNELDMYVSEALIEILPLVECAAVFVIKLNGQKLIYQIDHDYYFNEGEFIETDPSISVTRIGQDYRGESFGMFDANNLYDLYGLIVEIYPEMWKVIST